MENYEILSETDKRHLIKSIIDQIIADDYGKPNKDYVKIDNTEMDMETLKADIKSKVPQYDLCHLLTSEDVEAIKVGQYVYILPSTKKNNIIVRT